MRRQGGPQRRQSGDPRASPAALAAAEEALFSEMGIRRRHGRPADAERVRQRPFTGERSVQCNPSVQDQEAYDVGKFTVGGGGTEVPLAQETGQG
jgi:hypothetical protein